MLTLQRLKDIRKEQRDNIVISNLLITIIGECEQISKNPSHNEILAIIHKMHKDNNHTLGLLTEDAPQFEYLKEENNFLSRFLPQPLTENELTAIINSQIAAGQNMSGIMKYLSENYKGRYDGKGAARLCNIYINGVVM